MPRREKRKRMGVPARLLALALAAAALPVDSAAAPGHPSADAWLDMLAEDSASALRFEEGEARAASREGLALQAGDLEARRALLARVDPAIRYPDSLLRAMLMSEAFVRSACPDEREEALVTARLRFREIAGSIPDSLLPPWTLIKPFLHASALRSMPSCRARVKVLADPGSFRQDCVDPLEKPVAGDSAVSAPAPDSLASAPRAWSPDCLRIKGLPSGACLVRSGKTCLVRVEEFNAGVADLSALEGPVAEFRAGLLRAILVDKYRGGQNFKSGITPADGQGRGGEAPNSRLPWVEFRVSTDSSLLAAGKLPWLSAYPEELRDLLPPLADLADLTGSAGASSSAGASMPERVPAKDTARIRRYRHGYYETKGEAKEGPMGRRARGKGGAFEARIAALGRALAGRSDLAERIAREAYAHGRAVAEPDTLVFTLWQAGAAPDTQACRPVLVRSIGADHPIESLAWKYSGRGKRDSLLGPFQVPSGVVLLKIGRRLPGKEAPPYPMAKGRILDFAARGRIVGSALGLWKHDPPEATHAAGGGAACVSPFPDKRALAMALANLQSGPNPAGPYMEMLDRMPEAVLLERYCFLRGERDLGAWMDGLDLTPEGQRVNLWF